MTDSTAAPRGSANARDTNALRERVTRAIENGSAGRAMQAARQLIEADGKAGTFRFLARIADAHGSALGLRRFKLALLSSFSIDFVRDALQAVGVANGIRIEVYCGPFGSFRQEIHDPESGLYKFAPDAVVLAVESDAWVPADSGQETHARAAAPVIQEVESLLRRLREHSNAALLCHNFPLPRWPAPMAQGAPLDTRDDPDFTGACNQGLRDLARANAGFYVVDYAALVSRHGYEKWFDDRMRHYARAPIAHSMHPHLAREYVKIARGLTGLTSKCLVVDLDNTLWGGILGEDGVDGVKLGPDYPGSAYVEFQRYVAQLQARGTILAIASKNNPEDVERMFLRHPFMVLKQSHFSSRQIGWHSKSESLLAISRDLNIGLEHMVFVDDSAFESEHVRETLPQVTVLQLPSEPAAYVAAVAQEGWFDGLTVSDEDRRRGELYRQREQAESLRSSANNLEAFYRELDMRLAIAPVDSGTLKRTAQLTQKTNQFNVTTRRYTEADVQRLLDDPNWVLSTIGVCDKFGDNGVVGVIFACQRGDALEIDTLLLSCRVIGRTVETAMLGFLCGIARARGLSRLVGSIIPTGKNVPVRDLYARHGFVSATGTEEAGGDWELDLNAGGIEYPAWFRLEFDARLAGSLGERISA
jgi:FkbH-like protein